MKNKGACLWSIGDFMFCIGSTVQIEKGKMVYFSTRLRKGYCESCSPTAVSLRPRMLELIASGEKPLHQLVSQPRDQCPR